MDKKEILEKAIAIHRETVADFERMLERYTQESDIDENETKDPEDYSHQNEATVMRRNTELQVQQAQADLDKLKELELKKLDSVQMGALVRTNRGNFFVSVSTEAMDIDGEKVFGISTEAPIYRAMLGKKAGDRFAHGDHDYEIKEVH